MIGPLDMLRYDRLYYKEPSDIMQLINRFYCFKEKRVFNDLEKLKMIPLVFRQSVPPEMNICLMMILSEAHYLVKDTFTEFPYDYSKQKHKQYLNDFIMSANTFDEDQEIVKKIGRGAFSAAASLYYNSTQKNDLDKVLTCAIKIKTLALIISAAYFTSFKKLESGSEDVHLDRTSLSQLKGYFEKFYTKKDQNQIRHHRNIYFILKETHKLAARNWVDGKDDVKKVAYKAFYNSFRVRTNNHPKSEYFERLFVSVDCSDV